MIKKDSAHFWDVAHRYLDYQLKKIRQVSVNTIESYRDCLNSYINYLENVENIKRKNITFDCFKSDTIKRYQAWMIESRKLSPKTCNLRVTAIRSFLEYAAQEYLWIMPIYADTCNIVSVKTTNHTIEYFEPDELKELLAAPSMDKRSDRRNQMILVFMYDTAARVSEVRQVKISDLHLDSKTPYVTLLGKGRKYRNIPLMEKTIIHLRKYLVEFHGNDMKSELPLFYSKSHGKIQMLSSDTLEKMIKRYVDQCRNTGISMPCNVHCHMLRKTRAMDLYREGIPLTHIQQLLGHENISTTSGFYAFATLEVLAEALKTIKPDTDEKLWNDPKVLDQLYRF